jgi:pectin lyase
VTISNSFIDGETSWSATCDGYHYWGIYLDGSNDLVTLKGNYIYHTSGRAPKVQGNTLLHAVCSFRTISLSPISYLLFGVEERVCFVLF